MASRQARLLWNWVEWSSDCHCYACSRAQSAAMLQGFRSGKSMTNSLFTNHVTSYRLGRGSDRASQDSRLRSQKGGVEFINFPFGFFGSEICSEQLLVTAARIRGQIQKSQTGSTRTQEFQESRNLIFEKRLSLL